MHLSVWKLLTTIFIQRDAFESVCKILNNFLVCWYSDETVRVSIYGTDNWQLSVKYIPDTSLFIAEIVDWMVSKRSTRRVQEGSVKNAFDFIYGNIARLNADNYFFETVSFSESTFSTTILYQRSVPQAFVYHAISVPVSYVIKPETSKFRHRERRKCSLNYLFSLKGSKSRVDFFPQ